MTYAKGSTLRTQLPVLLRELSHGCFHRRVAWPQHNRQRCLVCGSWRTYDLNRGIRGEWKLPERPDLQRAIAQNASAVRTPLPGRNAIDLGTLSPWRVVWARLRMATFTAATVLFSLIATAA
jgi:hypothetical protein